LPRPLPVGIVGTGVHGARYARHVLADAPDLALAAISRRSPAGEEQAREWGCVWHNRWEALVADPKVAAVIAAATPDLNVAIARACGAAGKPLLMEKPLAVDPAAAAAAVAAMGDLPFTVAQTLRYNPVVLGLRRELPRAGRLHSFSANQRLERSVHPWLEDPAVAGGGVLLHTAVHLFDALRFVTGRECLRVRAETWRRFNPNLEDLAVATLELGEPDGGVERPGGPPRCVGTIDVSKVGPARHGRYEFVGEAGTLQGDQIHGTLEFVRGTAVEALPVEPQAPTLPPLLADWAAFLRGEGKNPIPAAEGLAAVRIAAACAASAASGEAVAP
jgi:predicted dehydrogenase